VDEVFREGDEERLPLLMIPSLHDVVFPRPSPPLETSCRLVYIIPDTFFSPSCFDAYHNSNRRIANSYPDSFTIPVSTSPHVLFRRGPIVPSDFRGNPSPSFSVSLAFLFSVFVLLVCAERWDCLTPSFPFSVRSMKVFWKSSGKTPSRKRKLKGHPNVT